MRLNNLTRGVTLGALLAAAACLLAAGASGQDSKPAPPKPPAAGPVTPPADLPADAPKPPPGLPTKPAGPATPPTTPKAPQGQAATINVQCPANATIWIEGQKMTSTGAVRSFQSPPLEAGKAFYYTLKVSWAGAPGQKEIVTEQEVTVRAGQTTVLDFRPQGTVPIMTQPAGTPGRRPIFGRPEGSGIR